ncbi:hypothetical protein PLESTB_000473100 [Pleodorina starrii]|uniref:Uncharacterized protein n=1 Tax=Pleodorina starrii TaxID=330485 RepID=A0A9W6BFE3_9CHLO|nr:hypothetical protein PLESTM_001593600 [Pleodorina starrii]GLC51167.1 hypothetical protein PLESTB_000473100 [Pleodorina starrii]GLC63525.1 hypothetical protein PLESTF_000045600 [Pleodorina starrii]
MTMTNGTFDCRSYDLKSYACSILRNRVERFSTVYACCFVTAAEAALAAGVVDTAVEGQPATDMLLTSNSIGELRLHRLSDLVQRWTAAAAAAAPQSPEAACCCSWAAHQGAAYCLAKATSGSDVLIISGGDDGYVRGWRLADVLRHVQQPAARGQQQNGGGGGAQQQPQQQPGVAVSEPAAGGASAAGPGPAACLAVRLPRAESALAASSLPPAVQALATGTGSGGNPVVFVGCSDGGVHCLDLTHGSVVQSSGPGHVAAVLAMDHHGPTSCLATGSEDGTVRLWDSRTGPGAGSGGGGGRCVRVLDTAAGREVPGGGAEALRCLRNPPVSCLRFEPSGSWLLCGHGAGGGGGGSLSMWNLGMAQRARQVSSSFAPQAMAVQPAEVLVVGSEPALSRYSLALEGPSQQQPLATRSVFALDVHPTSGAVAVGGVGASLELLSKYGKKTGGAAFVSDED